MKKTPPVAGEKQAKGLHCMAKHLEGKKHKEKNVNSRIQKLARPIVVGAILVVGTLLVLSSPSISLVAPEKSAGSIFVEITGTNLTEVGVDESFSACTIFAPDGFQMWRIEVDDHETEEFPSVDFQCIEFVRCWQDTGLKTITVSVGFQIPGGFEWRSGTHELVVQPEAYSLEVGKWAQSDPVEAGDQLTWTIRVSNTGSVDLTNVTIDDLMPLGVEPAGRIVWHTHIPVGGNWVETHVVTVEQGYEGVLTNTVWVTSNEGATGVYTVTSQVVPAPEPPEPPAERFYYFPVAMKNWPAPEFNCWLERAEEWDGTEKQWFHLACIEAPFGEKIALQLEGPFEPGRFVSLDPPDGEIIQEGRTAHWASLLLPSDCSRVLARFEVEFPTSNPAECWEVRVSAGPVLTPQYQLPWGVVLDWVCLGGEKPLPHDLTH